ncbi:GntR family transcriptional regulator [Spirillospora sp. NBC_00431]
MTGDVPLADNARGWTGRPKSAQEVAMEFLLHGLRTGRYRAGEQIIPEAVADEVGVSHVPVREAVRKLEGRGTLTHRPRRGYFVTELDLDDLDTIVVLGSLLENEALRRALPVINEDQIVRMRKAVEDGRALQGQDPVGVASAGRTFHEVMLERGVPKLLLRHLSLLWSTMEPYRPLLYSAEQNQDSSCLEHEAILAAIEGRDVDAVIAAYDEHRMSIARAMRDLIPPKDPKTG